MPNRAAHTRHFCAASDTTAADPWSDYVISAVDDRGAVVSGWDMRNARLPACVAEAHSETAYTTDRALEFIRARGDEPWALHLSYVKPHWPYLAPAPYHARYTPEQCLPLRRDARELEDAHPVLAAYRQQEECANFMRDEVPRTVRPTYQGLVQQIDDHLGRVWEELERSAAGKTRSSCSPPITAIFWAITGSARRSISTTPCSAFR